MRIITRFLVLLTVFAAGMFCGSPATPPQPPEVASSAAAVTTSAPTTESYLIKLIRENEEREQALAKRLREPAPGVAFCEQLKPKVFKIFAYPKDDKAMAELNYHSWRGSACVVSHGKKMFAVSSAHLVITGCQAGFIEAIFGDAARAMQIRLESSKPDERLSTYLEDCYGVKLDCHLVKADVETDVAAFEVENPDELSMDTVTRSLGTAEEGSWVALGFNTDRYAEIKLTQLGKFYMSVLTDRGLIANVFQVPVPLNHGSSGGPVYNSLGELIGVCSSSDSKTHANLTHWASIERLLEDL